MSTLRRADFRRRISFIDNFGHRNFVHYIEILMTQRRLTNFAMPHMWRSDATTKSSQTQQIAEARPDSPATSSREGLLTTLRQEPQHALFSRRVEPCRVLCSSCCRIICLSRIGIGTFAPSGGTPTFIPARIPARLRAQNSSRPLCEPSPYTDATKYIRLGRHFSI